MPYIAPEYRKEFDAAISQLAQKIRLLGEKDHTALTGCLNYVFTRILYKVYGKEARYHQHNEIAGVLECIKQEWYRRQTAPYEDRKIEEHGDVFID